MHPYQVPISSGGGSGHEPAHIGYGRRNVTAAIYGQLFTLLQELKSLESISFFKQWSRCSHHCKNFEADIKEFSWAINTARQEGIKVGYSLAHDDISFY